MSLRQVGRVCRKLVSDYAILHVFLVRQSEVFFRRDITQHRGAKPPNHRRSNRRSNMIVSGSDVGREWTKRVERRFMTSLELLLHVYFDQVHRHVTWSFDHHLAIAFPRDVRQLTKCLQFGKLRLIIRVRNGTGSQTITQRERNVVRGHDLANLAKACVKETLFVMGQAPLRHDRSTTTHDPRRPARRQRNVRKSHAGVNRKVINTLLRLLDQRVAKNLPRKLLGFAADFFKRLVNRHGADRYRRVANYPFARRMNVLTGGEIHHRIRTTVNGPTHLVDFLFDRRRDRRVSDVRINLNEKVAPDDHRLGFRMVDVRRDDGATTRDFITYEFRSDVRRYLCPKRLA